MMFKKIPFPLLCFCHLDANKWETILKTVILDVRYGRDDGHCVITVALKSTTSNIYMEYLKTKLKRQATSRSKQDESVDLKRTLQYPSWRTFEFQLAKISVWRYCCHLKS